MFSLLYVICALIGLGVLIFIHELGHYFSAKWTGMNVEEFSIGFGRPLVSWKRNGVTWKICWIPFGGYVKISGMEPSKGKEMYEIEGGFFSKHPFKRILVSFMGPFANFILAFAVFSLLFSMGGREKNLAQYTSIAGYIDPESELYAEGVRPGDQIIAYDDNAFSDAKDHLFAALAGGDSPVAITGLKVDYETNETTPFTVNASSYQLPESRGDLKTLGVLQPANALYYSPLPFESTKPLSVEISGIEEGDRIVWVDGHRIFSLSQLSEILNDDRVLLTVKRDGETFLKRVPRMAVKELFLTPEIREELEDWQFGAKLRQTPLKNLFYIPYNLTEANVIEGPIKLIESEKEEDAFLPPFFSEKEAPLKEGDQIVAIGGERVMRPYELFEKLQTKKIRVIVEKQETSSETPLWTRSDEIFQKPFFAPEIDSLESALANGEEPQSMGQFALLKEIEPIKRKDFPYPMEQKILIKNRVLERKKELEKISDPAERKRLLEAFEATENQWMLGMGIQDLKVRYNPGALEQCQNMVVETYRTLSALIQGNLNPKWVAGPVGIVHAMHFQWAHGIKEAIYWLGLISMNLGLVNLLPIPILDGGYILLSCFEWITGIRLKGETLEKLMFPFMILLIGLFVFFTFNDLSRLFKGFFN